MEKICGKITSLPRKMKKRKSKPTGTILVTRGDLVGQAIKFSAPFELIPYLKLRMLVCLHGEFDNEKKHFYISDLQDISRDLTGQDIEALSILAPGLISGTTEEAMNVLELSRVSQLVEMLIGEKRDDSINKLANILGEEKAFSLIQVIDEVTRDRDQLNVYKLFKSCTALDFQHAVIATDKLSRRASRHGISVAQLIEEYPWILAQVFEDDGLIAADTIAKKQGKDFSIDRCKARIMVHLLRDVNSGHSYTPYYHLWGSLSKNFSPDIIKTALKFEIKTKNQLAFEDKKSSNKKRGYYILEPAKYADQLRKDFESVGMPTEKAKKESKAVFLPSVFLSEVLAAQKISKILNKEGIKINQNELKREMQNWSDLKLDKEQLSIADKLAKNKIVVVTGKAGSGKTTTIKSLIHALQHIIGQPVPVLAPTGTAAQKAGAEVGANFSTIHRWTGITMGDDDYSTGTSEKKENENSEKPAVVVVDEMSMATITVFHRLLHVTDPSARFVLVGDPEQLPAIGPGGVFDALIKIAKQGTKNVAYIDLQGNYRTKDGVTINALRVREGKLIDKKVEGITLSGDTTTENSIIKKTIETVKTLLEDGATWEDIAVLGSTRTKGVGTEKLNLALKKEFGNPPIDKDIEFSIGDPVIAIRNDYADKNIPRGLSPARKKAWIKIRSIREERPTIFNGTRGIVTNYTAEEDKEFIEVVFQTPEGNVTARYNINEVKYYIELAYAITVHKMQGGQAKFVLYAGNTNINKQTLYTILTRSTEKVWLIGPDKVWEDAVQKENVKCRSKFKYRILDEIDKLDKPEPEIIVDIDKINIDQLLPDEVAVSFADKIAQSRSFNTH